MTEENGANLIEHMQARITAAEQAHANLTERWNSISNARLIAIVPFIGLGFWWLRTGERFWLFAALLALAVFFVAVWQHNRVGAMRREAGFRLGYRREQLARIERGFDRLPAPRPTNLPADHPYANDLDLVGQGSVLHLIDTTETAIGFATLVDWLSRSDGVGQALDRQQGAMRLAGDEEWCEDLAVAGSLPDGIEPASFDPGALKAYGQRSIAVPHVLALIGTVAMLVGVGLYFAGVIPGTLLLFPLALNAGLTFVAPPEGNLHDSLRGLRQLRQVLPVVEQVEGSEPILSRARENLYHDGVPASHLLSRLDRQLAAVIPKGSILWFPLQLAVNWDLLVDAILIRSSKAVAPHIERWIATVGEIEALAALANLKFLNPEFAWPALSADLDKITIQSGGHPLIPVDRRVTNDVSVGPEGSVMIVTGSNMAGKSTLLRTVGLNAVLALAGGPVCAQSMEMGQFNVWSSVRVQDSLAQGVSLFMAELVRLRQVVDAARSGPVLYLLDEILHGTNTSERRIAARTVIWHLLRTHGVGMVSTHDLELIDADLQPHTTIVHLVDQIRQTANGPEMYFDYKVRPGMAPSSNALRLLELVGLGPDQA